MAHVLETFAECMYHFFGAHNKITQISLKAFSCYQMFQIVLHSSDTRTRVDRPHLRIRRCSYQAIAS